MGHVLDGGGGDETIHSAVLGGHLLEDDILTSSITDVGLHIAECAAVLLGDLVLGRLKLLAREWRAVDGIG